jgi:hypothetical protein
MLNLDQLNLMYPVRRWYYAQVYNLAVHCLMLDQAIKCFAIYESASIFQRLMPTSIATLLRRI